ncbi:DUF1648 domain-containing protein [Bacillus thermotolerans]|uniref:DUF1648 domain-containing protein n=1 Tax=Bacillus thermotolerans TaxID=1221996 RepID=A0A0F5IC56_BACTR|nr:DUF5808 domain-containing protein [Bacillus thermotolerans]KKB39137.1 hypothetical protein QY97_00039 [Bacillus thermotolerans]KKB41576.1 hypothetical protein QY96_01939 [Bacillus thermotolerans]KKB42757.1 hypothetical protein QY95_03778 [Bacillus thermotolerans]
MSMEAVLLGFIMIPIFIPLIFIPSWTRKTESFGVSIPEQEYGKPALKSMRRKYAWFMGALSVVTLFSFIAGASFYVKSAEGVSFIFAGLLAAYLVVSFLIYLFFHGQMKRMKQAAGWSAQKKEVVIVSTEFRQEKLTYSNLWFAIPFAVTIAILLLLLGTYNQLPERLPMQYDFSGEVTRYAEKSYRTVLLMPIMQVYLTLLFLFINTIIARAKQQVSASNPEQSMKQNIVFRRRWSAFTILSGIAVVLLLSLPSLSFIYPMNTRLFLFVPLAVTFIIVGGAIVLSITTGQGGSRIKAGEGKNGDVINRDEDQYWKLGQFYFNKNDPAIFIEKRFGIGWTNNWAHPLSWVFIVVVVGLAIGLPILLGG